MAMSGYDAAALLFLSLFHQVMGVKLQLMARAAAAASFLSLFHQVMGVKLNEKES